METQQYERRPGDATEFLLEQVLEGIPLEEDVERRYHMRRDADRLYTRMLYLRRSAGETQ